MTHSICPDPDDYLLDLCTEYVELISDDSSLEFVQKVVAESGKELSCQVPMRHRRAFAEEYARYYRRQVEYLSRFN